MRKPKSSAAKSVKPEPVTEPVQPVSAKERYQMIAEAAYFRAEKRGFTGGSIEEDWIQAEAEIDHLLQEQEKTQKIAATAKEVELLVQSVLENDTAAVSGRVRTITLSALSGGVLNTESIRQVMGAVIKGAQQGAASHTGHEAKLLKEAMQGLDDALAAAAEATQLALKEAAGRTSEFSQQELKSTMTDLAALESLFIETLSNAAQSATGTARTTLHDLAHHARVSGTVVGEKVASAVSQLAHIIADTTREQVAAGTQTLRKEGALFASLAAGVLNGLVQKLQPKTEDKNEPKSPGRDK